MSYSVDPRQILSAVQQGQNPQQLMLSIMKNQMGGTPAARNLISLVEQGDSNQIEQFARNLVSSQGKDFDTEFQTFKQTLGL